MGNSPPPSTGSSRLHGVATHTRPRGPSPARTTSAHTSYSTRGHQQGVTMTNAPDRHARAMLPIPDRPAARPDHLRRQGPGDLVPADRAAPPAGRAPRTCSSSSLDDVGFGASSAFGGPCNTPTAERLAAGGLRYNRFHTTALCAPTRQALLTGRNHHSVGMGNITETATSAPGQQLAAPEHHGAARPDADAQRLLHRPVRQVPRGPRVAVVADGTVRRVAVGRRRVRALLRVHRRREQPVGSRALRGHHARSSRPPRRRRATTSPTTSPTTA